MSFLRLYHGCPSETDAYGIHENGLRQRQNTRPTYSSVDLLTPRRGRVYLTPDMDTAIRYARMEERGDRDVSHKDGADILFQVDIDREISDIQLDEDDVSEACLLALRIRNGWYADKKHEDCEIKPVLETGRDEFVEYIINKSGLVHEIINHAERALSPSVYNGLRKMQDDHPRGDLIALAGKQMIEVGINPDLADEMFRAGANVSLPEPVVFDAAWKIPVSKQPDIAGLDPIEPWPAESFTHIDGLRI